MFDNEPVPAQPRVDRYVTLLIVEMTEMTQFMMKLEEDLKSVYGSSPMILQFLNRLRRSRP